MIVDFDVLQGEWFTFFESRIDERGDVVYADPKPNAGRVCIRSLTPYLEEVNASRKRTHRFVLNESTRAMERISFLEDVPPAQVKQEKEGAWDYIIVAWEGIQDKSGNDVPCTRENKLRLMALPIFDRFAARCLQLLAESGVKAAEVQEKNA